jgi:hypothetical protein
MEERKIKGSSRKESRNEKSRVWKLYGTGGMEEERSIRLFKGSQALPIRLSDKGNIMNLKQKQRR